MFNIVHKDGDRYLYNNLNRSKISFYIFIILALDIQKRHKSYIDTFPLNIGNYICNWSAFKAFNN